MTTYHLSTVLLADGWARDVAVEVDDSGLITAIGPIRPAPQTERAQRIYGTVLPGMPNVHSHAFQRAMVGDSERRHSGGDNFWSWRQAMYALAQHIEPETLEAVAAQLFVEMLTGGYTAVAEFHYLHRPVGGAAYQGSNPLWDAIDAAARATGIGLTLLPTLYLRADFGPRPLRPEQARFALAVGEFLQAIAQRRAGPADPARMRHTGAAFHSLRAVPLDAMRETTAGLAGIDPALAIHIHVAEQLREVRACERDSGRRPVDLLLDSELVTAHWCLVHATHASPAELGRLLPTGASVCLCPSTEGNLGDGFFNAQLWCAGGGGLAIGSDSEVTLSPAEELRWLEYGQRLRYRRRAVLASDEKPSVGAALWREAATCGARALDQPCGVLAVGRRADWLVLEPAHPALAGATGDTVLDRLVFGHAQSAIRDVMVGGRWVIRDRHHADEERIAARFARAMSDLAQHTAA